MKSNENLLQKKLSPIIRSEYFSVVTDIKMVKCQIFS